MKKILAVITLLSVILTQTAALAITANSEDLIFDMDLSAYTAKSQTVKNKVTNQSTGITVYGRGDNSPQAGIISSISGETKVLTTGFDSGSTKTKYGMVSVDNTVAEQLSQADELSFEVWTKSQEPKASYRNYCLFNLAGGAYADADNAANLDIELKFHTNGVYLNTSDGEKIEITDYPKDEWAHWVITRKWNVEKSKFDNTVYINGVQKGTVSGGTKLTKEAYSLSIGGAGDEDKTYLGQIADFKAYQTALTAADAAELYKDSKDRFVELPTSMTLVSPTEGTVLQKSAKELKVEFNNYIDKDTLAELELLNAADESVFEGATMSVPDDNTKSVTFKLNGLNEGQRFILRVGEVESINGYSVTPCDINLSVFDSSIVNEDFSDWSIGTIDAALTDLEFWSSGNNSTDDFEVKTKGSKKYIEGKNSAGVAKDTYVAYNMPTSTNGKDFCLEIGVLGEGDATSRSIRACNGGTHYEIALSASGSSWGSSRNGTGLKEIINDFSTNKRNDDGFFHLVFTFIMDDDGTYTVYGTSPDNSSVNYQAKTTFTKITQIKLFNQYNIGSEGVLTGLGYFKIYEYVTPKVSQTSVSSVKADSDYIELTFDDDMTGFNDDSFKLSKTDKTAVEVSYDSYDESTRTAKIKLGEYLDYGTEYTLTVDGPKNLSGTAMRKSTINFTVPKHSAETTATKGTDNTTVSVKNNAESSKDVIVSVVMYDVNGKLLKTSGEKITIPAGRQYSDVITCATGTKKALVYVFELIDGEYRATTAQPIDFDF